MTLLDAIDRYERLREHVEGWAAYIAETYPEILDPENNIFLRALEADDAA